MFEVSRVFHLTHVVDDMDACLRWYDDVLGAQRLGDQMAGPTGGQICLLLVGDLVLLPLAPVATDAGTTRFRERFGEHLHSIAWFVEDPADLIDALTARGLALRDEYGRPVDGPEHEIWTPPRQAPCLLEFFRSPSDPPPDRPPVALPTDPRYQEGWSPAAWLEHPLGIVGTACITVVAEDQGAAVDFFTGALRGSVLAEVDQTPWATRSTMVAVGAHTVVEVATPLDTDSLAARDLAANGGILHALTFQVADLAAAEAHLAGKGLAVTRAGDHGLAVDPADTHGLVLRFTDRPATTW